MPQNASAPTNDIEPTRKGLSLGRLILFLFGASVIWFFGWVFYVAYFGIEVTTERTRKYVQSVTFNRFELRDATLSEAAEIYGKALKEAGINERKVRVRVMRSGLEMARKEERATLLLENIPAIEVGKYIAAYFDLRLSYYGNEARIYAPEDEPLFRQTIRIDRNFVPSPVTLNPDGSYDLRQFLEPQGVDFPKGAWAKLRPGSGRVELFLPKYEIQIVDAVLRFVGASAPPTWRERVVTWIRSWF